MREPVSRIVDRIGGLTVIEGEAVLDNARRLIWLYTFTGRAFEECAAELDASPVVIEVAGLLLADMAATAKPGADGPQSMVLMLGTIDAISMEVRLLGWTAAYRNDPTSAFGRYARTWTEEAERYAAPPGSRPN